ncbi:MAG: hypothetical protein IJU76_14020 [Desulfovibrionaceae bacterium]|nr:hypothetical protein [Desulfovibrionaceae bacterium]
MKKIAFFLLSFFLLFEPHTLFALTKAEFAYMWDSSPMFRDIVTQEKALWMEIVAIAARDRRSLRHLREEQREWVTYGLDEEALIFVRRGIPPVAAYTKAFERRVAHLKRERNTLLRRGENFRPLTAREYDELVRISPGFRRAERALEQHWEKLCSLCVSAEQKASYERDQEEWVRTGRDAAARAHCMRGMTREKAYIMASEERLRYMTQQIAQLKAKDLALKKSKKKNSTERPAKRAPKKEAAAAQASSEKKMRDHEDKVLAKLREIDL